MDGDTSQYRSSQPDDQGMILVLVLVLLGMITALVIQSQMVARMALGTEERKIAQVQLRAAATDAAWEALRRLADDDDRRVDHTNEPWAAPGGRLLPNGIATSVQIEDENRSFDINSLSVRLPEKTQRFPLDIVQDILVLARQPDPQVQARVLRDWLDLDHAGLREADYYRSLDPPVTIADALMESPQELAEVLARSGSPGGVPPGLAVLPDRGRRIMPVNLNTAERDVITAVLGPQNAAVAVMLIGLRDAVPLTSLTELNRLMKTGPKNPGSRYLDVKSSFFSVTARAAQGQDFEEVYALVSRDVQGNVDILRWVCR